LAKEETGEKKKMKPKVEKKERERERESGWGQSTFQRYNPKPPCDFPTTKLCLLFWENMVANFLKYVYVCDFVLMFCP